MSPLSPRHPVWAAGFRPFFLLAMLMGVLMPAFWGLVYSGNLRLPAGANPVQWHAHEMLFGFGGAVLIGFLLTASKNWVKVRGIHGAALMGLTGLWILERVLFYFLPELNPIAKHLGLSLFIVASGAYIVQTLIRHQASDSFKDNYFFVFLLAAIVLAKNLLVSDLYYLHGVAMTLGLFRLAFALMFERTIPQFMKNTEGVTLPRSFFLDYSIKGLVAVSVFQSFFPKPFGGGVLFAAGLLLILRWLCWQPYRGFKKFGNATMYVGYLALAVHFALEAIKIGDYWSWGTLSLHVFTLLCMGIVIPSMMVRISKGHTGRSPKFSGADRLAILLIATSAGFRLFLPLWWPEYYLEWVIIAGLLWTPAFLILFAQLSPFLLRARIDGKAH